MPRPRRDFVCEKCGFSTRASTAFKRHAARKTSCVPAEVDIGDRRGCIASPAIAGRASEYSSAAPVVPDADKCPWVCGSCDRVFSSKRTLANHRVRCVGVDDATCPACGKEFENRHAKFNHRRRGKCVPMSSRNDQTTNNSTTNINDNRVTNCNNHNDNSVTTNVTNVINLSFGSEETSMIECADFMHYLSRFRGPERLIPAAKAIYNHPRFPQNHGILRPKSLKRKSVLVRGSDGVCATRVIHVVFDEFRRRILPLVISDGAAIEDIEEKFRRDPSSKHVLTRELFDLVGQSAGSEEGLDRGPHEDRYFGALAPPGRAFEWPSQVLERRSNLSVRKHVLYLSAYPERDEMFGVAALYRLACGSSRLPAGSAAHEFDNELDDRWCALRVWSGGEWAPVGPPPGAGGMEARSPHTFFFACMAVDICDMLLRACEASESVRRNAADKVDRCRRIRRRLLEGRDHAVFAQAMAP